MEARNMPKIFDFLLSQNCATPSEIFKTEDGFYLVNKSLADILLTKNICDFPDSAGERLACERFFDDWYLYAVPNEGDYTYSLLKLREQEHDAEDGSAADGDTPGVTICFIPFDCSVLLDCLSNSGDEYRSKLNSEINRVVVCRGQRHHNALKRYFKNPSSDGPYLVAALYVRYIANFANNGCLPVPESYRVILQQSVSYKNSAKYARLPRFIDGLNQMAGRIVCDSEYVFIEHHEEPSAYEAAAILATHTGNTSVYSFAAEVEYHAKFLMSLSRIKIPFFGRSVYESAIRADMTVGDPEFEGPAPFYQPDSKIVKRQYALHHNQTENKMFLKSR